MLKTHSCNQAGREVRVIVTPEEVDEAHATVLAHDIAQQIQNETKSWPSKGCRNP